MIFIIMDKLLYFLLFRNKTNDFIEKKNWLIAEV